MKVLKNDFLLAMKKCLPGVEKGSSIIEGADTFVFSKNAIHSYNDSISVSVPFKAELSGAVKSVDFFKFISKLSGDNIEIEKNEESFKIKAGKVDADFVLQTSSIIDHISTLNIEELEWKKLPGNFFDAVRLCKISCNHTPLRGIFISDKFVRSTDIYRINRHSLDTDMGTFWLDDPAVTELLKIDKPKEYVVSESWVHFRTDDKTVFSCKRRDESSFPIQKVDEMIDQHKKDDECIENELPAGLASVTDRISTLASDVNGMAAVRMTLKKDKIEFYSERVSGKVREEVALEKPFKDDVNLTLWMDPAFLMEAAQKVKSFYIKKAMTPKGKERQDLVFYNPDYIQIACSFAGKA